MDIVTTQIRSQMMAAVPQTNTQPELAVRQIVHALGYRFRVHRRDLPGSPDIVLPRLRKVIFVHGCFWHRHGCRHTTTPSSRRRFWLTKFKANRARDARAVQALRALGWQSYVVWACQLKRPSWLVPRLRAFLCDS
jgi:DNA mismatch endonuclease, patch repair protein